MGAFGDNLRRERELRGITLSEISESTKISKRWLKALEDEEFTVLPGGVFNRGFVRAYARFLGIDEEAAVADYVVASKEQQSPEDRFPLEIHEKPDSPPLNPKRSALPVLLAVVALVLVVGGWAFWTKHKAAISAMASQQPETATASLSSSTPAVPVAQPVALPKEASAQSAPRAEKVEEKKPEKNLPDVSSESVAPAKAGSKQPPAQAGPDVARRKFNVVIKARSDSWISIAADGRPLWQGTLAANNERSVSAGKELVLKTGNAAGIEVSYNGRDLGTLGKDKEVRTLTFNTAGLQQ